LEKDLRKKFLENKFTKFFFIEKIFPEKILQKKFLPTLVEVSSNRLKLEENETFLLQWVVDLGWDEGGIYLFTPQRSRPLRVGWGF